VRLYTASTWIANSGVSRCEKPRFAWFAVGCWKSFDVTWMLGAAVVMKSCGFCPWYGSG